MNAIATDIAADWHKSQERQADMLKHMHGNRVLPPMLRWPADIGRALTAAIDGEVSLQREHGAAMTLLPAANDSTKGIL